MSALTFDKNELGNLEYSLQREMLATDRRGGYMSTTIVCCNTRKYHGLMVAPIDDSDRTYVLLSSLDETIVQHDQSFNLALHRFKGTYEPRGHKYITDFEYTPTPTITYRVGGVILRKELLWIHHRTQLMIRYTLVDAHSETRLRLRPFFAFRDKHALSKANMEADGRSYPVSGGVKCRLYNSFPWLYLQTDKRDAEFVQAPDWYYNFEYQKEIERGYDGYEDLLTTGYFETELKKGESIIFSASVDEMATPATIDEIFADAIARRTHKIDFLSCLRHSARQFVIHRNNRTEVIAGYPWEEVDPRQALISLPGITLEQGNIKECIEVLDTFLREMEGGTFYGMASAYHEADTPLWFFWVLQQLERHIGAEEIWQRYGETMKTLLESYRRGIGNRIELRDNGLLWVSEHNMPLTWMNSMVCGKAVTPRSGYIVEVNALWYNAVCYAVEMAKRFGDRGFFYQWKDLPSQTHAAFLEKFWVEEECYLADYVNDEVTNKFIRPNMIIACGLDYKMLTEEQQIDLLRNVGQHLLTPKGLRTLTPRNPLYKGSYEGSPEQRDTAAMNGTVWVWPLAFYVKALFDISGTEFLASAEEILSHFDEEIQAYGIGSINEMFDADPPYTPRGAISQAWSVGALLQICELIGRYTEAAEAARNKKPAAKKTEKETDPAKKTATKKPETKTTPAKTTKTKSNKK